MGVPVAFETIRAQLRSTFREDHPPAVLSELAVCTWIGTSGWERTIHVVPDGCCDLTFDGTSLTLTTPTTRAMQIRLRHAQTTIGIQLRPERARTVFGNMSELGAGPVDAQAAWDGSHRLMRDLTGTDNLDTRRELLVAEIARRHRPIHHDALLTHARMQLQRGQPLTVVATSVGMSERHLRREFAHAVGLSPKQYSRIARFQRALALLREQPAARFTTVAAAARFVDEAHLARECRSITGVNLTELRHRIQRARPRRRT